MEKDSFSSFALSNDRAKDWSVEAERNKWIEFILKFISDHGGEVTCKWDDVNPKWATLALEELLEVREQVAAGSLDSLTKEGLIGAESHNSQVVSPTNEVKRLIGGEVRETPVETEYGIQMERSDQLTDGSPPAQFLYLCRSTVNIPIVASDEADALSKLEEDFGLAVDSVMMNVPDAVVNEVIDRVYKLLPGSIWEDYTPHGDYYGPQGNCGYYTIEAHNERHADLAKRRERMITLLDGLNEDDVQSLKSFLLNDREREAIEGLS